ncbi:C4 protein [Tomato leaf curl Anjouan virus]|uniref:C4 protein n=1 Tax=Tomato leaf curl Anjouan virus TaxID=439422 RepID=A7DXH8_9GEMI|nr:C4 protein [Tomato leaf curl Anjouan virus]CAM91897.1 C4 protein [Tomato leaf curl Anjouan virus]
MGCLISTYSSNSKGNSSAQIKDSSTWYPKPGQHISIRTFRELNHPLMSRPILRKEGNFLTMEFSRSMPEVHGGRASI